MKRFLMFSGFALMMSAVQAGGGHQHMALPKLEGARPVVGTSPWGPQDEIGRDRKSTRLNSSHDQISYAVFCLKKKQGEDKSKQSANPDSKASSAEDYDIVCLHQK